jgi:hypothetical protein
MSRRLDHPGHIRLPDGSVLRLDFELGRFVATHYRPDMTIRNCVRGGFDEVRAAIAAWAAAMEERRAA